MKIIYLDIYQYNGQYNIHFEYSVKYIGLESYIHSISGSVISSGNINNCIYVKYITYWIITTIM